MKFFGTSYLHIPKEKKRKLKWKPQNNSLLDMTYVSDIKKIKLLRSPGYHFEISALVQTSVRILWRFVMGVHKNQSDGQNCV